MSIKDLDEWMPVDLLIRKETVIPSSSVSILVFDVTYLIKHDDGTFNQRSIQSVKSDQLRIIASEQEATELNKPKVSTVTAEEIKTTSAPNIPKAKDEGKY